jgi:hypothetical protein
MRSARNAHVHSATLDLLEREDREIRALFDRLERTQGPSVEERTEHGNAAKQLVRHVGAREGTLTDVVVALGDIPALSDVVDRIDFLTEDRRNLMYRLKHMSEGVQSASLTADQDFDGRVSELTRLMRSEIEWELSNAIPTIRDFTGGEAFQRTGPTVRPAPADSSPTTSRRYEQVPVLSLLVTKYEQWRDRSSSPR